MTALCGDARHSPAAGRGVPALLVAADKCGGVAKAAAPGGVVINEQAQVVHEDGSVIPGLYAVGELIGSANIDGHVTVGGFIHSMVVTFSLIAAESIAAQ